MDGRHVLDKALLPGILEQFCELILLPGVQCVDHTKGRVTAGREKDRKQVRKCDEHVSISFGRMFLVWGLLLIENKLRTLEAIDNSLSVGFRDRGLQFSNFCIDGQSSQRQPGPEGWQCTDVYRMLAPNFGPSKTRMLISILWIQKECCFFNPETFQPIQVDLPSCPGLQPCHGV